MLNTSQETVQKTSQDSSTKKPIIFLKINWKPYPEFTEYEVTPHGMVRKGKYNIEAKKQKNDRYKVVIGIGKMEPGMKSRKRTTRYLDRMVAETHVPNPFNLPYVVSRDGR